MAFETLALSIYCYLFSEIASSEVTWPFLTGSETGEGKYLFVCLHIWKVEVTPWHGYAGTEGTRHYKGVGGEHQAPAALAPGNTWRPLYKRLGEPRYRGRSRRHWDSNVRHPSSRYTDYPILGARLSIYTYLFAFVLLPMFLPVCLSPAHASVFPSVVSLPFRLMWSVNYLLCSLTVSNRTRSSTTCWQQPSVNLFLSQMNPVHILIPYVFKIHFNMITSMTPSTKWSHSFRFPTWNFVSVSVLPLVLHFRPSRKTLTRVFNTFEMCMWEGKLKCMLKK
jgi:hypothetical protein